MRFRIIFLFFVFLLARNGIAFSQGYPVGGRSAGLANASVMLNDYWSLFQNQAGIAFFDSPEVGIYHQRGLIKQLGNQAIGMALPTSNGTIGASCSYFGFSKYHEVKIGTAYSMLLDENLAAGVQLDYFYTHIDGFYGNAHSVAAEVGVIYQPLDNLYLGTHIFNPFQSAQVGNVEKMPTIFRFGAGYKIHDEFLITAESEMDLARDPRFKAGLEYEVIDNFFLRTGITTNPVTNAFGIGYSWRNIVLDVSFTRHIVLGYSPQFSLNYSF
jgi:hypothetical protein